MPPTKSTMTNPNIAQVPITPTDGSAQPKSPSHARAIDPSPIAPRNAFTGPP